MAGASSRVSGARQKSRGASGARVRKRTSPTHEQLDSQPVPCKKLALYARVGAGGRLLLRFYGRVDELWTCATRWGGLGFRLSHRLPGGNGPHSTHRGSDRATTSQYEQRPGRGPLYSACLSRVAIVGRPNFSDEVAENRDPIACPAYAPAHLGGGDIARRRVDRHHDGTGGSCLRTVAFRRRSPPSRAPASSSPDTSRPRCGAP